VSGNQRSDRSEIPADRGGCRRNNTRRRQREQQERLDPRNLERNADCSGPIKRHRHDHVGVDQYVDDDADNQLDHDHDAAADNQHDDDDDDDDNDNDNEADNQLDHDDDDIDARLVTALCIERARRWHCLAVVGDAVWHPGSVPNRQWIQVKCARIAHSRLELGTECLQPANSDLSASKHCARERRERDVVPNLHALSFQRVCTDDRGLELGGRVAYRHTHSELRRDLNGSRHLHGLPDSFREGWGESALRTATRRRLLYESNVQRHFVRTAFEFAEVRPLVQLDLPLRLERR
jgi:hypothetical protein